MQDARCTRWLRYGRRSKTTPVGMGSDKDKDTDMAIRCITTVPSFETKQSKVRSSESTLPQRPTQLHDLPSTFPNFESALPRFRSLDQLMRAVQMSESGHSDMQSASGALGGYGLRLRSPCSGLSIFGKDGHRIRLRHQLADSAERWMFGFYR